jgi:hypothetical protein
MEKKMNERIKELTIQALAECDPTKMTPLSSSVDNGDGVDIPLEFSKKFAELIVREAARFLAVNSGYDDCNNAWFPEPEDMLEHFGVTE